MENQTELERVRKQKEGAILRGGGIEGGGEIFSTVAEYASAMGYPTTETFAQVIEGKNILDLGSGLGGLAKDAFIRQIKCKVVSLNPRLATGFRRSEKESTKAYVEQVVPKAPPFKKLLNRLKGTPEKDYLKETQESHDKGAVAGFAYALPFQDNSFDLIFDKDTVSKYAAPQDYDFIDKSTPEEKELFRESIREMMRVLKPGGRIRIADIFGYGSSEDWKQKILDELKLDYKVLWEDLTNKDIYPNLWGDKRAIGVEIIKP